MRSKSPVSGDWICRWRAAEPLSVDAASIGQRLTAPAAVGVDGCRGGWFFFAGDDDGFRWGLEVRFSQIMQGLPQDSRVMVDIPIGLAGPSCPVRVCDTLARRRLGPRSSSVFSTPSRAALDCADYADASRRNHEITGRKLSRQSWNLFPRIREVDAYLDTHRSARAQVFESHPELCFAALAGGRPMTHYKKTEPGFAERLELLCAQWPEAPAAVEAVLSVLPRSQVARDDIMDALVLAVTARLDWDNLETVPAQAEHDQAGLPMAMVCPRALSA